MSTGVMAWPEPVVWVPGLATDTWLVINQVNEVELENPALSVAVMTTGFALVAPVMALDAVAMSVALRRL